MLGCRCRWWIHQTQKTVGEITVVITPAKLQTSDMTGAFTAQDCSKIYSRPFLGAERSTGFLQHTQDTLRKRFFIMFPGPEGGSSSSICSLINGFEGVKLWDKFIPILGGCDTWSAGRGCLTYRTAWSSITMKSQQASDWPLCSVWLLRVDGSHPVGSEADRACAETSPP